MPGFNSENKPLFLFEGDYHPAKMYEGNDVVFQAKEVSQTALDMAFEHTYNDRVDVVAQGRSKQGAVIANPQILQFPASYIQASIAGRLEIVSIQGHKITLRSLTTDAAHRYLYAVVPMTLKAEAYSFKYLFQVVSGSPIASTGSIRILDSALRVEYAYITSKSDFPFTPPAAGNYALVLYLAYGNAVSSEVVASFDFVAISASEASVNSPSPDYPSPIISANGDLVVEGRNLCPGTINKINEPYNQGNNTIIDWPSFPYGSGMYIVSCFLDATNAPTGDLRIQYRLYADNGTTIEKTNYTGRSYGQAPGRVSHVFTAIKGRRVQLFVSCASEMPANTLITAKDAMLERGPVAHPYTPYRPIITNTLPELRAIPDGAGGWIARDEEYIARVGGEWHRFKVQRIRHREFTGVESGWYMSTWSGYSNARAYGISTGMSDAAYTAYRRQYMCSHFVANALSAEAGPLLAPGLFFINNTKNVVFGMDTATFTTLAQWLSFLAANPITVDYVLATPIITDLGPIDLPSYYPYTRVLIEGEYPPDVTARCRVADHDI